MLVYRVCNFDEYSLIFQGLFDQIGKECKINSLINNHKYEKGEKYLHFFNNKKDIIRFNPSIKHYICTYDIPIDILNQSIGVGYYRMLPGYFQLENVTEYAVKKSLINKSFLIKIEKPRRILDYDDAIENFDGLLDEVYPNNILENSRKLFRKIK